MLNTDIWNYKKKKIYFKCQIKTASRWKKVAVKWAIAIERNN